MPYVSDKIKLSFEQDRRRKLSDESKEAIRHEYATGQISQSALARKYVVSRSLIALILYPERMEKVRARSKAHWREYVPPKRIWTAIIREHRRYKRELYLKGELK